MSKIFLFSKSKNRTRCERSILPRHNTLLNKGKLREKEVEKQRETADKRKEAIKFGLAVCMNN